MNTVQLIWDKIKSSDEKQVKETDVLTNTTKLKNSFADCNRPLFSHNIVSEKPISLNKN